MANPLRRSMLTVRAQSATLSWSTTRPFSSSSSSASSFQALIELKLGELGMISGIPEEHRRSRPKSYADNFKWRGPAESKEF